ncbi:MAG: HAMP domain-containing protein [Methylococcaceae bacterium]|nr:HAMP domain-containing protein [Methylococcaceae bacterium]
MGRLFWKFFLAYWLALLLAGTGVGTVVWLYHQSREEADRGLETHGRARALVDAAGATLRHGGVTGLTALLKEWERAPLPPVYAADAGGRDLLDRPLPPRLLEQARRLVAENRLRHEVVEVRTDGDGSFLIFVAAPASGDAPTPPGTNRPSHGPPPPVRPPPTIPIAAGILASLGFSAWLAWDLSTPIQSLRAAFAALAGGQLSARAAPRMGRRRDEIADLGSAFDHMAEQLGHLVAAQRRLLHDVSHELRSPLARLQAAIGLARQQPEHAAELLDRVDREIERLDRLVGELLTLSRLEAGMPGIAAETFDLVELVSEVVADAIFEAHGRNLQIVLGAPPSLAYHGQAEFLSRAVENVIRNALQHAPDGSQVEVCLTLSGRTPTLALTVLDQGDGVPEAELTSIFEPFFRGSRPKRKDGTGLGLAIARLAIERHGGTVHATNRPGGGLQVEIRLPLTAETGAETGQAAFPHPEES